MQQGNTEKRKDGSQSNIILSKLLSTQQVIRDNKGNLIEFPRPVLSQNGNAVFYPRTINIIQGKSGVHKSRLVESMCSCLLNKEEHTPNSMGFEKVPYNKYVIAYVDTERNLTEQFPSAIQRILLHAGYEIESDPEAFEYTSLQEFDRNERLDALIIYIENLSESYPNKNIIVVLDVISDCLLNFNDTSESMRLIDFLNQTINRLDVTFLCIIHENPGSVDKARGHLGTELNNKSSTVIQIGYEKDKMMNNTDLIKINYLKCRSSKRHEPFYVQFSQENKILELAPNEVIRSLTESRQHKAPMEKLLEVLPRILLRPMQKSELLRQLTDRFDCGERVIEDRLKSILEDDLTIIDPMGRTYKLKKANERSVSYNLELIEEIDPIDKFKEDYPF